MNQELKAHQQKLEELYSKNQLMPRIKAEFKAVPGLQQYIESKKIDYAFALDLMAQMALYKRADLPTLVGILRHHFNNGQATADHILKCAEADLVDWAPLQEIFIVRGVLTQAVQDELDRFQFPLPMVVEPRKVKSNLCSAYLLGSGSLILKDNHHDEDICLDHINRVNRVKLTINTNTVKMVKNEWKNLDKVKDGESKEDYERRVRAFEKYDRTAHDVIGLLMKESDHFYLTHKYDKRGRTYCQGYHVTYQGNAWNKAVIELADKEIILE